MKIDQSLEYSLDVRAEQYYRGLSPENLDPDRVRRAINDARTRVNEWSYEADAHGYCHDRTDWIALLCEIERLRGLTQVYGEEEIGEPDGPGGLITVTSRGGAEQWVLTCDEHGELGRWPVVPYTDKTEPELAWDRHVAEKCP